MRRSELRKAPGPPKKKAPKPDPVSQFAIFLYPSYEVPGAKVVGVGDYCLERHEFAVRKVIHSVAPHENLSILSIASQNVN